MDCRGDELIQHNNRTAAQAVPFQYLINEQAKSILALQELQNEVGALLEFRDMVMDTFPHLRHKQASSPEPSSGSQGVGSGESRWEPGVRVRRKLQGSSSGWIAGGGGGSGVVGLAAAAGAAPRSRSNSHGKGPKSGEPAAASSVGTVQDSGFCTESKDSSSTSSRTTMTTKNCGGKDDEDDELWSLLEMIQDKGTKLKLEVESLQNRLLVDDERLRRRRRRLRLRPCRSVDDLLQPSWPHDADDLRARGCTADYDVFRAHVENVKRERDALLDRVTEMEAESLSNAAQIHRLLAELKTVVCENRELEERLCGGKSPSAAAAIAAATIASRKSSSSHNGGFAPVQPESSTGPSSSSAGRDAFYTPSQHSACNLSSIELQCGKLLHDGSSSSASCASLSSSSAIMDDGGGDRDRDRHRSRRVLLVRPSDPISRNLEGRASSPALDIGSPTFAKRLGALDGVVSSPGDRIGKPHAPGFGTPLPKRTLAAILKTFNPIELQRHLITVSYENKNLVRQMEMLNISKSDVANELNKSKEDNEELKFQLEEKRIELEGTMARVRLLQLHQEQQQHGPVVAGSQSAGVAAAATNQWLDLVPSNPILPQIALPGTPSAAVSASGNNLHLHQHLNHSQDENGGSSSTESAHQTRSGGRHGVQHQPSKIPVVKPTSCPVQSRPSPSYRGGDAQQYQSWTKCKSDQSLPRNWESINNNNSHNKSNGGSSIGSGVGGAAVKQQRGGNRLDSSQYQQQQQQHRSRRDSGGGASLTRARSQNNHSHRGGGAAAKEFVGRTASSAAAAGHQLQQPTADDTNKPAAKKLFRRRNLVRQSRCLMEACKKPVLPAVDEVQEPQDDSVAAAVNRLRDLDDGGTGDDDDEFFFDSIESSLATSACSSRPPPPECDSIDLSQPDSSLTAT
ncbi:uncharacterized protein LOC100167554 [Acyrthosiphon pisum]|uniref:Uncharacterized protein n=1 Tax=Acyrthosiphon pisum TaxID=7029 RepID=A0A8R1W5A9_ACYPI|nr:uncharacterized protein LOC100167554 [Acyrthosiphon pisum]|eukprot:XP_001951027.2 PREDICTED: uncharacterized protein LOC100167554 [Acyrthosiphon pisum]